MKQANKVRVAPTKSATAIPTEIAPWETKSSNNMTDFVLKEIENKYSYMSDDGEIFWLNADSFYEPNQVVKWGKVTIFYNVMGKFVHPENDEVVMNVTLVVQDNKYSWLNISPVVKWGEAPIKDENNYVINSKNIYSPEWTLYVLSNLVMGGVSPEVIAEEENFFSMLLI